MANILIAIIFIVFGVFVLRKEVSARKRFRPVTATVTRSEVRNRPGRLRYYPAIEFRYEVRGSEYRSERYRLLSYGSSRKRRQQRICDRFPPGMRCTAWYDAENPALAVLVKGVHWGGPLAIAVGLTMLVAALLKAAGA